MKKLIPFLLISLVSCGPSQKEYDRLKVENDSLKNEIDNILNGPDRLLNEAIALMNEEIWNQAIHKLKLIQIEHKSSPLYDKTVPLIAECEKEIQLLLKKQEAERIAKEKAAKKAEEQRLASVRKLKKKFDDVSGITWYYNPYFTHYDNNNAVSLYMGKKEGSKPWLILKMSYTGDDWIFFKNAYLSYDGNTREVSFDYYKDRDSDNGYGGTVWEWLQVSPSESQIEFIRSMVKGKDIKMRLSGKYSRTTKISGNMLQGLKDVLLAYDVLNEEYN